MQNKVLAVIWDFDGTIVDSRERNLKVTRKIIREILGNSEQDFPVLKTLDNYYSAHVKTANWREFYKNNFGFDNQQIDETGKLWTKYQLEETEPIPVFGGIDKTIIELENFPQGIVSQNSRSQIIRTLTQNNLQTYFKCIIGYEEVDIKKQKPNPEGLLRCIKNLTDFKHGVIFYVGDHETDVTCVLNANTFLKENNSEIKILCMGAYYGFDVDYSNWSILPDYEIQDPQSIVGIVRSYEFQK